MRAVFRLDPAGLAALAGHAGRHCRLATKVGRDDINLFLDLVIEKHALQETFNN
jgi:hypothetical protein